MGFSDNVTFTLGLEPGKAAYIRKKVRDRLGWEKNARPFIAQPFRCREKR